MIKEIENIDEINELLREYKGADLFIEMYSSSLKRVFIGVVNPITNNYLFIVGVGCLFFNGFFSIEDIELTLYKTERNNSDCMTLKDLGGKFEMTGSSFGILIGNAGDYLTEEFKRSFMFLNDR